MTTLYCAILVAGFMATASLADIDPQRMQRDIRIMEGVLSNENLYYDVPDGANFRARGLYLDGYGVLFVAAGPASGVERWDKALSQEELLTITRDLLAEFLGDYAGTIGQLDPDDRITVCYRPHSSGIKKISETFKVSTDSAFFDLTKQAEAMAALGKSFDFEKFTIGFGDSASFPPDEQIKSILDVAEERIEKKLATAGAEKTITLVVKDYSGPLPFEHDPVGPKKEVTLVVSDTSSVGLGDTNTSSPNAILLHVHGPDADAASLIAATVKKSAIDAFREGRIDSVTFRQRIAFSERTDAKKIDIMAGIFDQVLVRRDSRPWPRKLTLGMYQPDVGALFSISDPMRVANPLPRATAKAKIVEAVADYGATLRQVQSDEHVIVEYRSPFSARSALLKVPKSAIDAYARGDLDLDAFRKKAVWETQ